MIFKKKETSSYSSLLQESDDRIHLSISKHSTSIQIVLYKQKQKQKKKKKKKKNTSTIYFL